MTLLGSEKTTSSLVVFIESVIVMLLDTCKAYAAAV